MCMRNNHGARFIGKYRVFLCAPLSLRLHCAKQAKSVRFISENFQLPKHLREQYPFLGLGNGHTTIWITDLLPYARLGAKNDYVQRVFSLYQPQRWLNSCGMLPSLPSSSSIRAEIVAKMSEAKPPIEARVSSPQQPSRLHHQSIKFMWLRNCGAQSNDCKGIYARPHLQFNLN